MKLGIIIAHADPETAFNALRLARYSLGQGDKVRVFLMGQGVELERIDHALFDVRGQARAVVDGGGEFFACGTCLELREPPGSALCPVSTLKDMYEIVRDSDRVLTF